MKSEAVLGAEQSTVEKNRTDGTLGIMHSVPLHLQNGKPRLQDAHKSTHESCNLIRAHKELCLAEVVQNPNLITRHELTSYLGSSLSFKKKIASSHL